MIELHIYDSIIQDLLEFYSASKMNSELHADINKILYKRVKKDTEKMKKLRFCLYTLDDFLWFKYEKGDLKVPIEVDDLDFIIQKLYSMRILKKTGSIYITNQSEFEFYDTDRNQELIRKNLVTNALFGFSFIAEKYKKSILRIEVESDGKKNIGTGFLTSDSSGQVFIVTANHCITNKDSISISDKENNFYDFAIQRQDDKKDIAIMKTTNLYNAPLLSLSNIYNITEEIMTMGFPAIPLSKDAYLVSHIGEINSRIQSYHSDTEYIIFSAKTSGGNSGGPLINKFGEVIGIVTDDFFEKEALENKGTLPYHASVLSKYIFQV